MEHSEPHARNAPISGLKSETPASPSPSSPTASSGTAGTADGRAGISTTPVDRAMAFVEARGLDPELAAKMGWDGVERHGATWLKIPYLRDGKEATVQYRRTDAKEFRFPSGSETELWNVDVLRDATLADQPLVLAEGACDGLALIQCGFPRTVAVPGWSEKNLDPERYEPFKRNEEAMRRAVIIVVAQHADNAGAAMLRGVANFFDGMDVRYAKWPDGCGDANDTLLLKGPDAVVEAIAGARRVDPPGGLITGFTDMPPCPPASLWKIDGFPKLDKLVAFRSREISVLTGTPASGKTTFATWLCHHLVRCHDLRIGMGLFETEPEEVFAHLFQLRSGGALALADARTIASVKADLDRNFRLLHRVDDGEEEHGMLWLKRMIHTLAARDGCNLIVVDPWNELEHMLEPGESMTNYINFALMRMRQWAKRYDIHIMITAHPTKIRENRKPLGYDISDSAAWSNKPGMGWTIHIEEGEPGENLVSLTTWKVRNRQVTGCRPAMCKLAFDEHAMVYRQAGQ